MRIAVFTRRQASPLRAWRADPHDARASWLARSMSRPLMLLPSMPAWAARPDRALRCAVAIALAFAVLAAPAPRAVAAPAGPTEGAAPPYDDDLMRLAEILGSLHYLRPLCGVQREDQLWRTQMQVLLDTEQPAEARRGQMIAAFNRGYTSYAQVYRACTASARLAVSRQLEEGSKLAHDIVVHYGGN